MASATMTTSCTSCHVWIREVAGDPARRTKAMEVFPYWERYEKNVASYMTVPSLEAAMARLDPASVEAWLADPHDMRPGLPETMPRFALTAEERSAIGAAFAEAQSPVAETPAPDPANVAKGAELFVSKTCSSCHAYGALHTTGIPLAPDLAHTRSRMEPDRAAAWIEKPSALSSAATMPDLGLSTDEAIAIRDYLWLADPGWTEAAPLQAAVEPTTSPVTWDEVNEAVFAKICAHCHMDPEQNDGRAGPGNAGGFGFAATGIELQTYEGVVAVSDRIPDALHRRRLEVHRDVVGYGEMPATVDRPERPGMPLGLPALSDEDTALVLGWIEQGMPR
ncbi:MAG: c-type cytochrome [Proteobacteria bacterium]|nr:c-type cytochrome [Pseudomonadota bacterium]MCP4920242.1 c-type cytochrome [Pseudomonadota bacterium]